MGLFLCAVAGFEFHVLYATEKMLREGTRPSALRGYGYALVETSLPTLVILYYATIVGPMQALLMPMAFVYFVFILLSTLRLDFALSAFTGLVAAAEYAAVALFWGIDPSATAAGDPTLSSLPHHLGKACILLVSRDRRRLRRAAPAKELHGRHRVASRSGAHPRRLRAARVARGRRSARRRARPSVAGESATSA